MAQAFITTNEKTYVKHDLSKTRRESLKAKEAVYEELPKGNDDMWLIEIGKVALAKKSNKELQKFVQGLYQNRNWTSYQVSYCKRQIAEKMGKPLDPEIPDNEIIEYGKRTFITKTQQIMPPLPTARKLYGYIRPRTMYMGLTDYQDGISRFGFDILLKNYEKEKELERKLKAQKHK